MNPNYNPKCATDSILEAPQLIGNLTVHPMTVARMALLELIDSPFVNPERKFNLSNMCESAFVMCADTKDLKGYSSRNVDALVEKAYQWADNVDVNALPEVVKSVMDKLQTIYKVSPSTGADNEENPRGNSCQTTMEP